MPDASTTRLSKEACGGIEKDSLKAAVYYIRGRTATSGAGTREGSSFGLYSRRLFLWASECGKVVSDSYISTREEAGILVYKDEGAEHVVYIEEANQRAVKVSRPGLGDVLEYLESLDNSNELFGDDVSIVGVFGSVGLPRIIISQRWIVEDQDAPDITTEEIDSYFAELRFVRVLLEERIAYYNIDTKILASDAHAGNFMRFEGRLVPIDIYVQVASLEIQRQIAGASA